MAELLARVAVGDLQGVAENAGETAGAVVAHAIALEVLDQVAIARKEFLAVAQLATLRLGIGRAGVGRRNTYICRISSS